MFVYVEKYTECRMYKYIMIYSKNKGNLYVSCSIKMIFFRGKSCELRTTIVTNLNYLYFFLLQVKKYFIWIKIKGKFYNASM